MAGCMVSVFAAFGEFVIVKVLDGQYQKVKKKQCEQAMVINKQKNLSFKFLLQEAAMTPWKHLSKPSCTSRRSSYPVIPPTWRNVGINIVFIQTLIVNHIHDFHNKFVPEKRKRKNSLAQSRSNFQNCISCSIFHFCCYILDQFDFWQNTQYIAITKQNMKLFTSSC